MFRFLVKMFGWTVAVLGYVGLFLVGTSTGLSMMNLSSDVSVATGFVLTLISVFLGAGGGFWAFRGAVREIEHTMADREVKKDEV